MNDRKVMLLKSGRILRCMVALLCMGATNVIAQTVPLRVEVAQSIKDQWGAYLVDGDYAQVLFYNGQIYPPNADGSPHTNNPVVHVTEIGIGTPTAGRFNTEITNRPTEQIFVRVWNTPSLVNASYYGDSQVFTPPPGPDPFNPVIESTSNAMDSADNDGDGLNNSDENDLGSDMDLVDTDGDGMFDFVEFRSGTELTNNLSYLAMVEMLPHTNFVDVVQVQWSSVPGYTYQLQYTDQDLDHSAVAFTDINSPVTATSEVSYTFVTNSLFDQLKSFRVKLVE